MNYLGSKKKLAPWIKEVIEEVRGKDKIESFVDPFAGTGRVSEIMASMTNKIIVNDFQPFCTKYLHRLTLDEKIVREVKYAMNFFLDSIPSSLLKEAKNSNFVKWYGGTYFTMENAIRIARIREYIQKLKNLKNLGNDFGILASEVLLLESADKVQNCSSNYSAYLKKIKPSAAKKMQIVSVDILPPEVKPEIVIECKEALHLLKDLSGEILYLDPPYNQRQYYTNYHILNTLTTWDLSFEPQGKTKLPPMSMRKNSQWSQVRKVYDNFIQILESDFKFIILSYNDEGLLPTKVIREEMEKRGYYTLFKKEYKKFKSNAMDGRVFVEEQLHVLIK